MVLSAARIFKHSQSNRDPGRRDTPLAKNIWVGLPLQTLKLQPWNEPIFQCINKIFNRWPQKSGHLTKIRHMHCTCFTSSWVILPFWHWSKLFALIVHHEKENSLPRTLQSALAHSYRIFKFYVIYTNNTTYALFTLFNPHCNKKISIKCSIITSDKSLISNDSHILKRKHMRFKL